MGRLFARLIASGGGAAARGGAAAARGGAAAASSAAGGASSVVARQGVGGFLKSMAQKFPNLVLTGGTLWGVMEGLDALAGKGFESQERLGPLALTDLSGQVTQIEHIVGEVVMNMTAVVAAVLRQHDQERQEEARQLEIERQAFIGERILQDQERNRTAASIAKFLGEIIAQQQSSNKILEKTEQMLAANPLMFANGKREGLWKRSLKNDNWASFENHLSRGEQAISSSLLKLADAREAGERADKGKVEALAGETATLISKLWGVKSRFQHLVNENEEVVCSDLKAKHKRILIVTAVAASGLGALSAYFFGWIAWASKAWLDRGRVK
jgi:hypothetical protein